jgi:hypothetical protein
MLLSAHTAHAQGDGVQRIHALLVNAIPPGGPGRAGVVNDVVGLSAALTADVRPVVVTTMGGSDGPGTPATWGAFQAAIGAAFGAADEDDVCIFYMGTHGEQVPDQAVGGDAEADGKDGRFVVGSSLVRDDEMGDPFGALLASNCGAGMVLMFMACHSGELIDGGTDDFWWLAPPDVVMTSCTAPEESLACIVGGHDHSCYGGAGLVRGLSDTDADMDAQADQPPTGNLNLEVAAAESHTYAVANDVDPGADPQSTAPGSPLIVLDYAIAVAHDGAAAVGADDFCQVQLPVGGIAQLPDIADTADSLAETSAASPGTYAALAGGLVAAVLALSACAWYARRRWLKQ